MTDHLATAAELAPLIERVHGAHHPELTRVRELTEQINASTDAGATAHLFRELRAVTDDYTVPSDGCEAFAGTYAALRSADTEHANRRPRDAQGRPLRLQGVSR
jgi:regulator of cell morphogenesis and NO signaling